MGRGGARGRALRRAPRHHLDRGARRRRRGDRRRRHAHGRDDAGSARERSRGAALPRAPAQHDLHAAPARSRRSTTTTRPRRSRSPRRARASRSRRGTSCPRCATPRRTGQRDPERYREVHPECAFAAMAGAPLTSSKKTREGLGERRTLLTGARRRDRRRTGQGHPAGRRARRGGGGVERAPRRDRCRRRACPIRPSATPRGARSRSGTSAQRPLPQPPPPGVRIRSTSPARELHRALVGEPRRARLVAAGEQPVLAHRAGRTARQPPRRASCGAR